MMFCTFIFAVLVLKYCFPTGDQLQSYSSQANIPTVTELELIFVPNFVGMATGVGQGKMQLAAFDGPSPKTPL